MIPKEIEDLDSYRKSGYLTVGELRKSIEGLSDDALVLSQRIEDIYFESHNWKVVRKSNDWTSEYLEKGDHFISADEEDYENPETVYSREFYESLKDEFVPVWCSVKYDGDANLYLHLHY